MTNSQALAIQYAHEHKEHFLSTLEQLLRIPSISTNPENKPDMLKTAEWLSGELKKIGMEKIQVFETKGHPIVFGEWLQAGKDKPTVLVYGHYDVQPPEPLELWNSQPFDPTVRDGKLFARGASDMKGQVMASIDALQSIMKTGSIPVNVKFIIEGEEEIGSPNLEPFIASHKELLACDLALNPDTGMIAPDVPTIIYALRGLAYFEVRVYGPQHDLHSGVFGGAVHNPAQALIELIAGMHDKDGHITLPGFYDTVRALDAEERAELARLSMKDDYFIQQSGVPMLWGEPEFTPVERVGARPTLEVNGFLSGFTGQGSKTVIPAWAMAKISMRLVPDQDPEEVHRQFVQYFTDHAPKTIRWEIIPLGFGNPCITERDTLGTRALSKAMETVWGTRPVFKREGGSVPVVGQMQDLLGADSVLTGFGLPDDMIHAPNEKLDLANWYRGIDALIHFFYNLGE